MNAPADDAGRHVRVAWKTTGGIEDALPYDIRVLMQAYRSYVGGVPEFYVEVPLCPPSANKIYRQTTWVDKKTGQMRRGQGLDKSVDEFRQMVDASCWRKRFGARGVAAAIIVIESSWVSKKSTVRKRDADNPVKATLDAISRAIEFDDSLLWTVTTSKMFSRRESTHIWLFDIGDVVNGRGGYASAG